MVDVDPQVLTCELGLPDGHFAPARIRFLACDGGRVSVKGAALAFGPIARHADVQLRFHSPRLDGPLSVGGVATAAEVVEDLQEVDLRFFDWSTPLGELDPQIRSYFNQRRAYRVRMRPGERVEVELAVPKHPMPLRGTLRDLSYQGMSVHLPGRQIRHLEPRTTVAVRFYLVELKLKFETQVRLAHVGDREGPHGPIAGGAFLFERGESLRMRRKLNAFSMRRQRESRDK